MEFITSIILFGIYFLALFIVSIIYNKLLSHKIKIKFAYAEPLFSIVGFGFMIYSFGLGMEEKWMEEFLFTLISGIIFAIGVNMQKE